MKRILLGLAVILLIFSTNSFAQRATVLGAIDTNLPSSSKLTAAQLRTALKAIANSVYDELDLTIKTADLQDPTPLINANVDPKLALKANLRWVARVGSTTSSATPTINTDNYDIYKLTAQTAAITSFTTNLSGTPVDGDILEIQITGTAARAIAWGTSFVASTVALPTTTVTTATLSVVFQYYTTSSYGNNKWVCVNIF